MAVVSCPDAYLIPAWPYRSGEMSLSWRLAPGCPARWGSDVSRAISWPVMLARRVLTTSSSRTGRWWIC